MFALCFRFLNRVQIKKVASMVRAGVVHRLPLIGPSMSAFCRLRPTHWHIRICTASSPDNQSMTMEFSSRRREELRLFILPRPPACGRAMSFRTTQTTATSKKVSLPS